MSEENSSQNAETTTEEETENNDDKFKTILYTMTREELKEEDLVALKENMPENFRLKASEDGDNIMFQRKEESGSSIDVAGLLSE